jgi:uncharacterized protein YxjI
MEFQFKEEAYGWGDRFYIYNDNNERVYRAKSSVMLLSKKMVIQDLDKNEVLTIKNEPKSLLKPKFYIVKDGRTVATVTKELSLVPKIIIEGIDWKMRGLMFTEYDMLQGEQEAFSMHQESTGWGFRPCLKIAPFADPITALGVAMTITYLFNMKSNETSTDHL